MTTSQEGCSPTALFPDDGILPPTQPVELKTVGIDLHGKLYLYQPDVTSERQYVPAIAGVIINASVVELGHKSPRGPRKYLSVFIQSPTPRIRYLLRLPAHKGQHSYRSLLAKLIAVTRPPYGVNLATTLLKLETCRGTGSRNGDPANFFLVSLDPTGVEQVFAKSIGPTAEDLDAAVNLVNSLISPDQSND